MFVYPKLGLALAHFKSPLGDLLNALLNHVQRLKENPRDNFILCTFDSIVLEEIAPQLIHETENSLEIKPENVGQLITEILLYIRRRHLHVR